MINKYEARLGTERMLPLVFKMALPAVVAQFVNLLYSMVDRIYIGHIPGIGTDALAGVGVTTSLVILISSFSAIVGGGGAPLAAMALGQGDRLRAGKILGNGFVLLILFTLFTSFIAYTFMEPILLFTGASENTLEYAVDYLSIYLLGTVFVEISTGLNSFINAQGRPAIAMYSVLIGALLNIILDPIFIFWLDMGIKGAAIATIISMLLCTLFVMNHFVQKDSIVRFHKGTFKLEKHVVWNILTIGVSPFAMQLAGSLVVVIQNYALKQHGGDLALGANGIITSVGMLLVMLIIGIAQGMQPIVGFNFGAKKYERVQETLRLVIITATIIMGVGCFCSVAFPKLITRAFTNDPDLLDVTANGLRISLLVFVVVGSQISISQFFQSIGIAWKAMFLSLSRQVLFLIPAMLLFSRFWGLDGVWYAAPFSDFVAAVTAWLFLWYHVKNMKSKNSD